MLREIHERDFLKMPKSHILLRKNIEGWVDLNFKVYPDGLPETFKTDHWRCRFVMQNPSNDCSNKDVTNLLNSIDAAGLDFIKTEHLYEFDGERGYSLGQGE